MQTRPNELNSVEPTNDFRITKTGAGIQTLGTTPYGGDIHDTLIFDEQGDVSVHTTARIPGGKEIHIG